MDNGSSPLKAPPSVLAAESDGVTQSGSATMAGAPTAAAAASRSVESTAAPNDNDELVARKILAVEQLTQVFGFETSAVQRAMDEIESVDVTALYNYILDQNLGTDAGGPVTPKENCPHISNHVQLSTDRLPIQPQATTCLYRPSTAEQKLFGGLKSDLEDDGTCRGRENWLCLECGAIRCSRYVNGHSLLHWEETKSSKDDDGHCLAVSLEDLSVWCYVCNAYVVNDLLKPITNTLERLKFVTASEPERKRSRSSLSEDENEEEEEASSSDPDGSGESSVDCK